MFLDNINFTVRSKPEARDSQRPKWKDRIRSKLVFPNKHIRLNILILCCILFNIAKGTMDALPMAQ